MSDSLRAERNTQPCRFVTEESSTRRSGGSARLSRPTRGAKHKPQLVSSWRYVRAREKGGAASWRSSTRRCRVILGGKHRGALQEALELSGRGKKRSGDLRVGAGSLTTVGAHGSRKGRGERETKAFRVRSTLFFPAWYGTNEYLNIIEMGVAGVGKRRGRG